MKSANGEVTLDYHVHHVVMRKQPVIGTVMGEEMMVETDGCEVVLTSERPSDHGSLTLRFVGPEVTKIIDTFQSDGDVELVLRYKNGSPPPIDPRVEEVVPAA